MEYFRNIALILRCYVGIFSLPKITLNFLFCVPGSKCTQFELAPLHARWTRKSYNNVQPYLFQIVFLSLLVDVKNVMLAEHRLITYIIATFFIKIRYQSPHRINLESSIRSNTAAETTSFGATKVFKRNKDLRWVVQQILLVIKFFIMHWHILKLQTQT